MQFFHVPGMGRIWLTVNILSNFFFLKPEHAQIKTLNCHFSMNSYVWCHNAYFFRLRDKLKFFLKFTS